MNELPASQDPSVQPPTKEAYNPPVMALVANLLFATRIADTVRRQGGDPVLVGSADEFHAGLERWPVLILVDLQALPEDQWSLEIRRAKALPQSRSIPIYAFGSHLDTDSLQAARQAGCDHVWARSRLVEELPRLVADHVQAPPRYPEGWDDRPSQLLLEGVALFNAGEFYRQHDVLEQLWMEDLRPVRDLYQGILQVGVAFHHAEQGNYRGSIKMLRRGLLRLRYLPPVCQTVEVEALRRAARSVHDQLVVLGPDRMDQFDLQRLHEIKVLLMESEE